MSPPATAFAGAGALSCTHCSAVTAPSVRAPPRRRPLNTPLARRRPRRATAGAPKVAPAQETRRQGISEADTGDARPNENSGKKAEEGRGRRSGGGHQGGGRLDVSAGGSPRLRDPFQAYMDEISRSEVLDHAVVIALAEKIKGGANVEKMQLELMRKSGGRRPTLPELAEAMGKEAADVQLALNLGTVAKHELVSANLRLVTSVAKKVQASKSSTAGLALDDMIQEGNLGLIRAAEKYDGSKGYRFSTYATWWVRATVLRAVTTQSRAIRLPVSVLEDFSKVEKERARQIAAGARFADDDKVAEAIGITRAKLRFVESVVQRHPTSLDIQFGDRNALVGTNRTLADLIPGEDDVEEKMVSDMQRKELDAVLRSKLKPIERAAVRLRFGLEDGHPRTLQEVGSLLSVSKERVRQLVFSALAKLKTPEVRSFLDDCLG